MAQKTNYSAAFGFDVYIVPIHASAVDLSSVLGGKGVATSGAFINLGTSNANVIAPGTLIEVGANAGEIIAGSGLDAENIVYDGVTVTEEKVIKLFGLTNASLDTNTATENIKTYDSEAKGTTQPIPTNKSWTINLAGLSQYTDTGYKVLRLLEQGAVDGQLRCKIARVGPAGTTEATYGYAVLTGYGDKPEAGSIVSYTLKAEGFGPYALDLDNTNAA